MKKHLRIAKILLAVLLLAAMLCPLIFITAEADHDCTGADCAICHQINLCENLLNSLGTATAVCAAAAEVVYRCGNRLHIYTRFPQGKALELNRGILQG